MIATSRSWYAYQRPTLVARKLRTLQLRAGEPHASTAPPGLPRATTKQRAAAERHLAEQAGRAYRRLIADWQATAPTNGAGATLERTSQSRQATQPDSGPPRRSRAHAATARPPGSPPRRSARPQLGGQFWA